MDHEQLVGFLKSSASKLGVDLKTDAVEMAVFIETEAVELVELVGTPHYEEGMIAARDNVALKSGIVAVEMADELFDKVTGFIKMALSLAVQTLIQKATGLAPDESAVKP